MDVRRRHVHDNAGGFAKNNNVVNDNRLIIDDGDESVGHLASKVLAAEQLL